VSVILCACIFTGTATANERVTHGAVIEKHPWVRDLGEIWVGTAGKKGHPPNQTPMFGGIAKNDTMRAADRTFFDRVRKLGATPAEGAVKFNLLGFRYFSKRELATSIKRFNQAWMLDPELGDVYHGFALIMVVRDRDFVTAEKFFRIAVGQSNTGPRAFADFGRLLLMTNRPTEAIPPLRTAVVKGPKLISAHAWLGTALFETGNVEEACEIAKEKSYEARGAALRLFTEILNAPGCGS
jgi:tetratricopeptide (TPR) repeat protein